LFAECALHQERPHVEILQHLQEDYDRQLARLAILHGLLGRREPVKEWVVAEASTLMQELRAHMIQEERECFPLIDHMVDEGAVQCVGLA